MKKTITVIIILLLSTYFVFKSNNEDSNLDIEKVKDPIQALKKEIGIMSYCKGNFFYNRIKKNCIENSSIKIYKDSLIKTGKNSYIKLKMVDDTLLTLAPESLIKFDLYEVVSKNNKNITISLLRGLLHSHFKEKVKKGSAYIKTRSAVMGVRGTEFLTKYYNGVTKVVLYHGLVDIENINNDNIEKLTPYQSIEINEKGEYLKENVVKDEVENKIQKINNSNNENTVIESMYDLMNKKESKTSRSPSSVIPIKENLEIKRKINNKTVSKSRKDFIKNMYKEKYKDKKLKSLDKKIRSFIKSETSGYIDKISIDNSRESDIIKKEIKSYQTRRDENSKAKLLNIYKSNIALPLIYPNGKRVFFDDDKQTSVTSTKVQVGIRVDYNLNPILSEPKNILDDNEVKYDNNKPKLIPVINNYGELDFIPSVVNGRIIDLPEKMEEGVVLLKDKNIIIDPEVSENYKNQLNALNKEKENGLSQENIKKDDLEIAIKETTENTEINLSDIVENTLNN